jgi:hypothetical protein
VVCDVGAFCVPRYGLLEGEVVLWSDQGESGMLGWNLSRLARVRLVCLSEWLGYVMVCGLG